MLHNLKKEFALNDLGDLQVNKVSDGILVTKDKYASYLLKRVNMADCNPVRSPLCTGEKLSAFEGSILGASYATQYSSIVGALQSLTLTRPDISMLLTSFFRC